MTMITDEYMQQMIAKTKTRSSPWKGLKTSLK